MKFLVNKPTYVHMCTYVYKTSNYNCESDIKEK